MRILMRIRVLILLLILIPWCLRHLRSRPEVADIGHVFNEEQSVSNHDRSYTAGCQRTESVYGMYIYIYVCVI